MYLEVQSILGAIIITIFEFIVGVIVNIILKWNVWNYATVPFNIMGQICLPFFFNMDCIECCHYYSRRLY